MANDKSVVTTADLRRNFLDVATERSQVLPRQNYAAGATLQFTMPKAGFGNYLLVDFQGTLTVTGAGGSVSLSPKAPYNLFKNVTFEDFLGITRVSCSGYKLYQREIVTKYSFDPQNAEIAQNYSTQLSTISAGAGGGAAGTYPVNFSVIVPIALHDNSTEGSFPFTLPEGENTLNITLEDIVGANNEKPFKTVTAGFTLSLTGSVGVTYYYWDVPKSTPLPVEDFSLIHELREIKNTDNISANLEKTFTLPTGRTYYMLLQDFFLNDAAAAPLTDINQVRFIVDGNTPTLDEKSFAYLSRMRRKFGRDLPPNLILFDFWRKPWSPSNYGSLQTGITLSSTATTTGNTYTSVLLESMYRTSAVITG